MEELKINKIVVEKNYEKECYYYEITNVSSGDVFLKDFIMYEADSLNALQVEEKDCVVFRSGRHKNDMPSIFKLGCMDDAMKDALGSMSESGDKLDADGNVRIIESDHLTILGNENGYTVITFPEGRKQLFATDISVNEQGDFVNLKSRVIFGIRIPKGNTVTTEKICIEHTKDAPKAVEQFAKAKALLYGARNEKHPSVFCTWYYYGLTVTLQDVLTNLEIMKARKLPFDVFQIDEGWEITLGEWEPNKKFPCSMKALAGKISDAGYVPGIWTSPFVAHETATVWKEHPDWCLKDKEGKPCLFPMNDTVYWVFDITNPATWIYFYQFYQKLTYEWGYKYHKLDFTRAAVIYEDAKFFDDTITLADAYYHAVSSIRKGIGEENYFLMCGGLYDPIVGIVDAQRTGSDVLSMWASNINKDGKTAPFTIKQSLLRYYMNAWWNNDPDALMVRKNEVMERNLRLTYGLLNDEEVKTSAINQYMGGGIMCSTEPLDKIGDDRLSNIQKVMPVVPVKVSPLELMDATERFPEKIKLEVIGKPIASIVRINWSDTEDMELSFVLTEKMLPAGCTAAEKYAVCDYYGHVYVLNAKVGDKVTMSTLKPHASTVIKIQPMREESIIVESDGHFSMGGEDIKLFVENGVPRLEYDNPFPWKVNYKVVLPGNDNAMATFVV